jgi:hypothetical protein
VAVELIGNFSVHAERVEAFLGFPAEPVIRPFSNRALEQLLLRSIIHLDVVAVGIEKVKCARSFAANRPPVKINAPLFVKANIIGL